VDRVLDGDLDAFMEAYLMQRIQSRKAAQATA
jgi:hypothetical protein